MRVPERFQRSETVNKVIHDVSWVSSLTRNSSSITPSPIFLQLMLLLVQRQARLDRHERRSARLESGCDTAERLALTALFLVLPCAEERLAPGGVCGERCAAVGLDGEDVRLEGEWVDELGMMCGERSDDDTSEERTYGFTLSGSGWMSGGSSTWQKTRKEWSEKWL
jgi:hypothetical protein